MRGYHFFFLDFHSAIKGVEILEADNDDAAVARAIALFREKGVGFGGFEVWDRGRRVHQSTTAATPTPGLGR